MTAANVPRETLTARPRALSGVPADQRAAIARGAKRTHRVEVRASNSKLSAGIWDALELESGRGTGGPSIRVRHVPKDGRATVVTIAPRLRRGDLLYLAPMAADDDDLLELVSVTAARLQDMTEAAARAEGAASKDAYRRDWDATHRAAPWRVNPWVWVYTFRRRK